MATISLLYFPIVLTIACPCCSDHHTHFFTKILAEKLGYGEEYENANVNIWMLGKEVDRWGIELMMETPHIN